MLVSVDSQLAYGSVRDGARVEDERHVDWRSVWREQKKMKLIQHPSLLFVNNQFYADTCGKKRRQTKDDQLVE